MLFRLSFPEPGFFLNNARLVVTLDGRSLFDGSLGDGFDVSLNLDPGSHTLETALGYLGSWRRQQISLDLSRDSYRDVTEVRARLHYNRLAGNFKRRLTMESRG